MSTDKSDLEPLDPETGVELFIEHKATDCAASTVQNHRYRMKHFLEWCDETESLTRSTYYELDIPLIRRWRAETEQRAPELFEEILADRDESMAGHLHALASGDDIDTVVASVGVQHLTGIIDLLSDPSTISEELIECPPLADYRLFPRDSPYSSYSDG